MIIQSMQRLYSAIDKKNLKPVADLTLSTLMTIAGDPKDPRYHQARQEAERRKRQSKMSQPKKQSTTVVKQNKVKQQNRIKKSKKMSKTLNLMKSPV